MSRNLTSRARTTAHIAAAASVGATLLLAGCSRTETPAATGTSSAGTGAGSTASTAAAGGPTTTAAPTTSKAPSDCPDKTVITIHTDDGDKTLETKAAKGDVTLGSTVTIAFGNFDFPDSQIDSISAPTLTGDQLYANIYLSAVKGDLTAGTYNSSSDELGDLQLNTSQSYTAAGRNYFTGFADVKEHAVLTKVDKATKKICGSIETQLFSGTFTAEVVEWS